MLATIPKPLRRGVPLTTLALLVLGYLFGPRPWAQLLTLIVGSLLAWLGFALREGARGRRADGHRTALDALLVGLSFALGAWTLLALTGDAPIDGGSALCWALAFTAAVSPWVAGCSRGAGAAPRILLWSVGLFLLLPVAAGGYLFCPRPADRPDLLLAILGALGATILAWRLLVGDIESAVVVGSPAQQRRCRRARFGATALLPALALTAGVFTSWSVSGLRELALLLAAIAVVAVLRSALVTTEVPARSARADRADELAALAEFTRLAAHEIRNSLSVLFSTTDLLRRDRDESQREELLDVLSEEGDRVRDVMDQLTAFAGEDGSSADSTLRLREVARAAARRAVASPDWPEGLRLELDLTTGDDVVIGDSSQLEIALSHVLRAAAQGGATSVQLRTRSDSADRLVLVEGDGQVSPELVMLLPSRLVSGSQRSSAGLGLAVAQRALREHGGELRCSVNEAGGLRAELVLPAEAEAARRR